jgi:hypothetical protein
MLPTGEIPELQITQVSLTSARSWASVTLTSYASFPNKKQEGKKT